jgi:signal peptidase I
MNEPASTPLPGTAEPEPVQAQLPAPTAGEGAGADKAATSRAILREIVETVALFAIVFTIARFAIGNYSIVGQSMEPNYHETQRLLVDKVSPHLLGYSRGDIVIVHSPNGDIELIKRLIGKPGDTIELRDNRVFVNGEQLNEPYLPPGADSGPKSGSASWTLGENQYFIMGDNRSFSQDSRSFGPVEMDSIVGRALVLYWPFSDFHVVQHYAYQ